MFATVFKQDSISWKIKLLTQRIQESWEVFSSRTLDNVPDIPQLNLDAEWIKQLVKLLLWSLVAIVLVWLVWQLWLLFRPYWLQWRKQREQPSYLLNKQPTLQLSVNQWLERSQEYQKQRDYRQAIFCLYQAMIQELSDRQIIAFSASRTDREYWKLINNLELPKQQAYKLLLFTHEQLCFSQQEASQNLWQKCQQAYHLLVSAHKVRNTHQ